MAYENPAFYNTFKCSSAVEKNRVVRLSTDANTVVVATDATTTNDTDIDLCPIGVAMDTTTTDSTYMTVQIGGIAKVDAAATTVEPGSPVTPTSNGKVTLADFSGTNTHVLVLGISLDDATSTDDQISVLINPYVGNSQS
jgi:hypothetical protein